MANGSHDLTRTMLAVLFIAGLIGASLAVLQPFLAATVWAATLVVATWPVLRWLESALGGRRGWAVTLMTLTLLVLVILPLSLAIGAVVRHADVIASLPDAASNFQMPQPPVWLSDVPLIGGPVAKEWQRLSAGSSSEIASLLRPYARTIAEWLVGAVGGFGGVIVHLLLTIGFSAVLYAKGEAAAGWCRRFGQRLAGPRGEEAAIACRPRRSLAAWRSVSSSPALAQSLVTGVRPEAGRRAAGRVAHRHHCPAPVHRAARGRHYRGDSRQSSESCSLRERPWAAASSWSWAFPRC